MTPAEHELRQRLREDLPFYAQRCLKIRNRRGSITPLSLNGAQMRVHCAIEAQREREGRVRVLIPKARQWGCSTYVEARLYQAVTHRFGVRAFIMTHTQDATDGIFDMARHFHAHCPSVLRPSTGRANAKEMWFDALDSGFEVGTAGTKAVGRGRTVQLFHGSEVAYWPNAAAHVAGALQGVPDEAGTEVILESTANGIGGVFHDMCMAAAHGEGGYDLIFVPWHWHQDYVAAAGSWMPPAAWRDYEVRHGLARPQTHWAWRKNADLARVCGGSPDEACWLFKQEYPADVQEAFQAGGAESFIRSDLVAAARRQRLGEDQSSPVILGVDVARGGGDKTRLIDRRGRRAGGRFNVVVDSADLMEVAGIVARAIDQLRADAAFIDVTGIGAGVVDRLREQGYRQARGVNFGGKASEPDRYANKRAEMWGRMKDWLEAAGCADLPDDDGLHADICAPGVKYDSSSRTLLEAKEDIRRRLGMSPDGGDALALTFAEPVRPRGSAGQLQTVAELERPFR